MRARVKLLACAASLLIVAWSEAARAAPFALVWKTPDGCPSRERIVAATQANLGDAPSVAEPELFVEGNVEPSDGGFVVVLALRDAAGEAMGERRVRVEGTRCSAIEEPTTLVLAMMIELARPRLAQRKASPPPKPAETTEPRGRVAGPGREKPSRPAPKKAPRVLLGGGGVASLGLFPVVGLGVAIRGMYSPGSALVLGLETSFESGGTLRTGGGEVGFQLLSASVLAGMHVFTRDRFEILVAIAARGGVVRVSSTGYAEPQDEMRLVALAGPGALARAKLASSLFVEAFPQIEAVFVRDEFQLRSRGLYVPIHRPSPVEVRLSLGLSYQFQ